MTIDFTRREEIDWLGGEEAPPTRYSERNSEEEILTSAKKELVEPLAEEIKPILSPETRSIFANLNQYDHKLIAAVVLKLSDDEGFREASIEAKDRLSDAPPQEFSKQYPITLAKVIAERVKSMRIRLIGQFVASHRRMQDISDNKRHREAKTVSTDDVAEVVRTLRESGMDRIELAQTA